MALSVRLFLASHRLFASHESRSQNERNSTVRLYRIHPRGSVKSLMKGEKLRSEARLFMDTRQRSRSNLFSGLRGQMLREARKYTAIKFASLQLRWKQVEVAFYERHVSFNADHELEFSGEPESIGWAQPPFFSIFINPL